jgi:hypothetical protein
MVSLGQFVQKTVEHSKLYCNNFIKTLLGNGSVNKFQNMRHEQYGGSVFYVVRPIQQY